MERRIAIPEQVVNPERFRLMAEVWRLNMRPKYLNRAAELLGLLADPLERLIICEGPTDTAAMLAVGLHAVGVPSAGGGIDMLIAMCRRMRPEYLQIMADADGPGTAGAERVADALMIIAPVVIVTPLGGCKDSRAWVGGGAGKDAIVAAGDVAPVRRMTIHGGAI